MARHALSHDDLLRGERVRLCGVEPSDAAIWREWEDDVAYKRLLDVEPALPRPLGDIESMIRQHNNDKDAFLLGVRLLDGDDLIGFVDIEGILWTHGFGWLGIGIGSAAQRGKGYGREALELALGFAFRELNLHRIGLTVYEYNEAAIALYEKVGFQREGVYREHLLRDGRRFDMYLYGLLRHEWSAVGGDGA